MLFSIYTMWTQLCLYICLFMWILYDWLVYVQLTFWTCIKAIFFLFQTDEKSWDKVNCQTNVKLKHFAKLQLFIVFWQWELCTKHFNFIHVLPLDRYFVNSNTMSQKTLFLVTRNTWHWPYLYITLTLMHICKMITTMYR